jgi:hypothetical protein
MMNTWTITDFEGHYPVGTAAIVIAENVNMAITILEDKLKQEGLQQQIKPEQLIPMAAGARYVRILNNGDC